MAAPSHSRSRRRLLCSTPAAPALEPLPARRDPPPIDSRDVRVTMVHDKLLRRHPQAWGQVSRYVAASFLAEWRRKYPAETAAQHWRRSYQHAQATLPCAEAYWLIGRAPGGEGSRSFDGFETEGAGLVGVSSTVGDLSDICAVTGLLVFRSPGRAGPPPPSHAPAPGAVAHHNAEVLPTNPGQEIVLQAALQAMEEEARRLRLQQPPAAVPGHGGRNSARTPHVLLHTNCVLPEYRGLGIGRRMVEIGLEWAQQQYDEDWLGFPPELRMTIFEWNVSALRSVEGLGNLGVTRVIRGGRGGSLLQFSAMLDAGDDSSATPPLGLRGPDG